MNHLEAQAKALYDAREYRSTPDWDQLGDVTKSVWRGYVLSGSRSAVAGPAAIPEPAMEVGETFDLF